MAVWPTASLRPMPGRRMADEMLCNEMLCDIAPCWRVCGVAGRAVARR